MGGAARPHYGGFDRWLTATPQERLEQKRREAEVLFHRVGITFAVYGEKEGAERLIPFDIVPRIIPRDEWKMLDAGLRQRVKALNLFLHDVYHDQEILAAGKVPSDLILNNAEYKPVMRGMDVPDDVDVLAMDIARDDQYLLVVTDNGFGKRTLVGDYRKTQRGAKGVKTIQQT